jgi:hypothetical protein
VPGFGWNFYGFFLFCIAWIAGYFWWAHRVANQPQAPGPKACPDEAAGFRREGGPLASGPRPRAPGPR